MMAFAYVAGLLASLLAGAGLFVIARWAVPILRAKPPAITDRQLNEIEGYAAIRRELVAIRAEIEGLSRAVNGLTTHVDGHHDVTMKAIGQIHATCKLRRPA
jgi:hypothetical protein